jgi:hypothetical protein
MSQADLYKGRVLLEKVHFLMHCYQGSLSTLRYEVNSVGLSINMPWIFKTATSGCFVWKRWRKIGFYSMPGTQTSSLLSIGEFLSNQICQFFPPLHLTKIQESP